MTDTAKDEIKVKKIENGTVIDHVTAGHALRVLEILGIGSDFPGVISLLIKVPSSQFGAKDLIKIEGKKLAKRDLQKLALIAPYATVNVIKDYNVVEKYRVSIPDQLDDVVKCPNPACITNAEGTAVLKTEERDPLKFRCAYCERVFNASELKA